MLYNIIISQVFHYVLCDYMIVWPCDYDITLTLILDSKIKKKKEN